MKFKAFLIFFIIDHMRFSLDRKSIESGKHTHYVTKRVLTEIPANFDRPRSKFSLSEISTSRTHTSSLLKGLPLYTRKCNNYQPKRTLSVLNEPNIYRDSEVPAKAI